MKTQTIDKYQIISDLGSGSFGTVYHVVDRALQSEKAIKILDVTDPKEFMASLEEAQILKKCSHKHIVSINEANIFPVSGSPRVILDLEFIAEGSLESAIQARWVSIQESVRYLQGALCGLEHAHLQNFLHRDIKPGNILLSKSGAKLSDFGLATNCSNTLIGSAKGYITHLPPEYWLNHITTAQTDIYAAGVTLYRAISNISDWRGLLNSIPNYRLKVQSGTLLKSLGYKEFTPKPIIRILNKACAADPTKRYKTAKEFRQQLDRLRFNIDWICISDFTWEGHQGKDKYSIHIDTNSLRLTFSKNGRRQHKHESSFSSPIDAVSAAHKIVAETTLK